MDTVFCIHCNEYSAYLCGCPEGYIPLGYISSPDSNVVALLYAHCKERTCEGVNVVAKLGVCSCIIHLSIAECILIWELLTDTVEDIGEGVVEDTLLRPGILTVTSHICL